MVNYVKEEVVLFEIIIILFNLLFRKIDQCSTKTKMDQFPDIIIEIIFSYLIDRRYYCEYDKRNFMAIANIRLVCRRFLNLEHYLVKNLTLGIYWTKQVYQLSQFNCPFWKRNLSYVHHLTFWNFKTETEIDCSIFTHLKSLEIRWNPIKLRNYENLYQLKKLFCFKHLNISKLTKTNIHYHDCGVENDQLKYDYGDECQINGCLIRHHDPF